MASADPVITKDVAPIPETLATVVPVAAAAALAGKRTQELGVVIVVEKFIVHVVVGAAPIVTSPAWLVPEAEPLVVAPQAPDAIDGVPNVVMNCPLKVVSPASVKADSELAHVMGDEPPPAESRTNPVVPGVVGRLKLYEEKDAGAAIVAIPALVPIT